MVCSGVRVVPVSRTTLGCINTWSSGLGGSFFRAILGWREVLRGHLLQM